MRWFWLAVLLPFVPLRALACDVALVLGVDVSHSIDNSEYGFQVIGMVEALDDPLIASALIDAQAAVTVVQWSGQGEQQVSIPWMRVVSNQSLRALQMRMRTMQRPWSMSNTAVGEALQVMVEMFDEVPDCGRKIIDFSGDGVNNTGPLPIGPRGAAQARGITINGLAIDRIGLSVTQYFKGHVLTGRDSFVITAKGYRDYPRALRKKLLRELLPPSS